VIIYCIIIVIHKFWGRKLIIFLLCVPKKLFIYLFYFIEHLIVKIVDRIIKKKKNYYFHMWSIKKGFFFLQFLNRIVLYLFSYFISRSCNDFNLLSFIILSTTKHFIEIRIKKLLFFDWWMASEIFLTVELKCKGSFRIGFFPLKRLQRSIAICPQTIFGWNAWCLFSLGG
jgi:hypothetical protein